MNYNPYAPPQAPPGPPALGGGVSAWTASQAISIAWERFKDVWAPLVGATVVLFFLALAMGQVPTALGLFMPDFARSALRVPFAFAWALVQWALGAFLDVGFTRMLLAAARGGTPALGTLFSGGDRFLPAFACALLRALAVSAGFVLLILPGVILALGLAFAMFFVIDAGLGPIEAMQASWQVTRGQKPEVFVLVLLALLVSLAGLSMCCVGIVGAYPLCMLAFAVAFTRISGRKPSDAPQPPGFGSPSL